MLTKEILNNGISTRNYIYHYTKSNIAIEHILVNNEILFNSLKNTNDPFEFEEFNPAVVSDTETPDSEVQNTLNKGIKLVDNIKNVCKIGCFSVDKYAKSGQQISIFEKGYCLPRMWSQYGENHYGVCFVFNTVEFLNNLSENPKAFFIPQSEDFSLFADNVIYNNVIDGLGKALVLEYKNVKEKSAEDILKENLKPFLFSKFQNYDSEQEFRVVIHSKSFKELDSIKVNFGNALQGIILGCRFNMVYLPSLLTRQLSTDNSQAVNPYSI